MDHLPLSFVVSPLPKREFRKPFSMCPNAPRCSAGGTRPSRSPWPIARFVRTLYWYSPLGKLLRGVKVDPGKEMADLKHVDSARGRRGLVCVAGATGRLGKRIVKELIEGGWAVRALVRDEAKARKVFGEMNVKVLGRGSTETRGVDLLVNDLTNPSDRCFEGVDALIIASGTVVRPPSNDEQEKNAQGSASGSLPVLDDTPENVEFKLVNNLVKSVKPKLMKTDETKRALEKSRPIFKFDDTEKMEKIWNQVDDIVMGGVSSSRLDINATSSSITFSGNVSSDNSGGFTSARTVDFDVPLNLSEFSGLELRVRGDGKRYKFVVRCDQKWFGVGHCYSFDTKEGEPVVVRMPWESFVPTFMAKTLKDGTKLNPGNITALQLMLSKFEYDGELNPNFSTGQFSITVDSISAYKEESRVSGLYPQIILLSSAGVTRVVRYENLEDQIPIVRMSKQLGSLLEWKLAGEDVIRSSGLRYLIVRPCALTDDKKAGFRSIKLDQGDNMSGRIPREDVASFVVSALRCEELVGTTVELAGSETPLREGNSIAALTSTVQKDENEKRAFAGFPYVPK